jgi:ABC-type dipeptide/oligopeptide/nickel transport system permease component
VWDTDGDGVPDHDERATGTDPGASDTDGDALSDLTDLCPLAREGGGADAPEDRDGDGVPDRCVSGHPLVPRWWERDPVVHKYACWLQNLAAGRAGTAEKYQGVPLVDLVRRSFVETAILIAFSMMLAGACALPVIALGYVLRRRRAVTRAIDGVFSLLSVPIVLVGYVLGALVNSTDFSVFATFDADVRLACTDVAWIRYDLVLTDARCGANYLLHLLLPALVLAVGDGNLGHFVRDMGQNLDDVSGRLFMRYARVRGIGPWRLALRYLLKNVMVPALTFLRYRLVFLLSGALVVEVMFDRKGMGRLMLNAINEDQDVPTFLACVLAFLVLVFVVQVAVRIAQTAIDRRLAQ